MLWVVRLLSVLILILNSDASPRSEYGNRHKTATNNGRLTIDVTPSNYKLALTLKDNFYETKSFDGIAKITVNINKNVTDFQLHSKNLKIHNITLENNKPSSNIIIINPSTPENDLIKIASADLEEGSEFTVTIEYSGTLNDKSMEGFYLSSYTTNNTTKYLATTQFEEMGARMAFPCFDEPSFKATFDITINFPQNYAALSNMKGSKPQNDTTTKLQSVTFLQTPEMSTYLVAFIVSDFECQEDENKKTEVCARPGEKETTKLALNTAQSVLDTMKNYTGYDYFTKMEKLTQAAIPDFAAGAMENWGLVTYREVDLLWDENQSSNSYKQLVVTVIAHELSHQWFGDLVTLNWWSDIFLNEGFATYFEYHIPNEIGYEDWELTKQFVIEQLQTALLADSSDSALPLSYNTSDPDTIKDRFDDISYNKGGSILRMVQHVLGLENFKTWLSDYIEKKQFQTSTPSDLWDIYNSSTSTVLPDKKTLADVMDTWTTKEGYPLLTVKLNGTNVIITQEAFVSSEKDENTQWYVPITYTLSGDPNFSNTTTQTWLLPDETKNLSEIIKNENQDWIILNNQQTGYYRVNYEEPLLTNIFNALNKDVNVIDEISRSQLVDDQFNLARANKKNYNDVFQFLRFLKNDTSYYSWYSAFVGFKFMLQKTADATVQSAIKGYVTELMSNLRESVKFDDLNATKQIDTFKLVLTQKWACELGNNNCLKESKDLFALYINGTEEVDPNLRSIVYCNGLRNSEKSSEDFESLWSKYQSTTLADERITILNALGCVNDKTVRQKYLEKVFSGDVRIQDARYVFLSVASNNGADGVTDVIDFLNQNYTELKKHFGDDTTALPYAIKIASDLINSQTQIDLLTKFTQTEEVDASLNTTASNGISKAEKNLQVLKDLENQLRAYFQLPDPGNSAIVNNSHFVSLIFVFVGYLLLNY